MGLEPPDNYFGPKRLFGNDDPLDGVIEEIFDNENYITLDPKIHTKDYDPDIPPTLREAIICFFIQDAIKNIRGIWIKNDSSMMVNVSRFTQVQNLLKIKIEDRKHLLKDLTESTSSMNINIKSVDISASDGIATCLMILEIYDIKELNRLKKRIYKNINPIDFKRV